MTFESLVRDYERLKYQLRRLEIKEREIRMLGGFPKSGGIEGMPKVKNNSSSVENTILKLSEIENQRNTYKIKINDARQEILTLIDKVTSLAAQEVIELKTFTPRIGWKQIADKVYLSESRCRHLYYEAIIEINKNLSKEKGYEV